MDPHDKGDGMRTTNPNALPTGIQRALLLAADDVQACDQLLSGRSGYARSVGVPLTAREASILDAVSAEQLAQMIDSVAAREPRVQPQGPVSLPPPTRGISPDLPPRRNEMMTSGGAAPDLPDGWANTPAAPSRRSQALWWLLMVGIGLGACALIVWLLVR